VKITSFNPLIVSRNPEAVIVLFEVLGFQRHHTKTGISDLNITSVRMKDANGFYVDVANGEFPQDRTLIRMNVDNLDEAIELLMAHSFKKVEEFKETEETSFSRFNIMISPSGVVMNVIEHTK
jgi:hypothetical protein